MDVSYTVITTLLKYLPIFYIYYSTEKVGNRDYILAIEYVTLDEDAEYTVVAKNLAGEAKTQCQLIVEPKGEQGENK